MSCSFRFTVTRRVSLVEQELLPIPEHLSSHAVFSGGDTLVFCFLDHCLLVPFLSLYYNLPLLITPLISSTFSVIILQLTTSDNPFDIFNLFCSSLYYNLPLLITPLISSTFSVGHYITTYHFW